MSLVRGEGTLGFCLFLLELREVFGGSAVRFLEGGFHIIEDMVSVVCVCCVMSCSMSVAMVVSGSESGKWGGVLRGFCRAERAE